MRIAVALRLVVFTSMKSIWASGHTCHVDRPGHVTAPDQCRKTSESSCQDADADMSRVEISLML